MTSNLNKTYTWLWAAWVFAFGVIEWRAIANKDKGDTLSEHIWALIGKREYQKQGAWLLWRIVVGGGLAWLIGHFFGDW